MKGGLFGYLPLNNEEANQTEPHVFRSSMNHTHCSPTISNDFVNVMNSQAIVIA